MAERGPSQIASEVLGEFQQRPIHEARVDSRMTRPTTLDSSTGLQRDPTVRLERHLLADVLARVHRLPASDERTELLRQLRGETAGIARKLDILNKQLYDPEHTIYTAVDGKDIGHHDVPVTVLDLKEHKEGEIDNRIPWVCIGGGVSALEQNLELWMSLVLAGEKIIIIPYPEKNYGAPDDWHQRVKNRADGTFQLHAEVVRGVLQKVCGEKVITEVNIMAHSAGVPIAIEALGVSEAPVKIHDFVGASPIGFDDQNKARLGFAFSVSQAHRTKHITEDNIKMLEQGKEPSTMHIGARTWLQIAELCKKKQITSEMLEQLANNMTGKINIFLGEKDPVIPKKSRQAVERMVLGNPYVREKAVVNVIKGADHAFPVTHAMGFVSFLSSILNSNREDEIMGSLRTLSSDMFVSSAAEQLLRLARDGK